MRDNKDKVCIIGLGYVGLTLAVHCSRNDYEVYGVEIDKNITDVIKSGRAHFHEPGINDLISQNLGKNFFVSNEVPRKEYDYIVISVGTPLLRDGKTPNIEILKGTMDSILEVLNPETTIILRSTVPVGCTREYVEKYFLEKNWKGRICFCPERTAEGNALEELNTLPQIISGNSDAAIESSKKFFSKLAKKVLIANSLEEAELIKLFNNTFRDGMFALANIFSLVAQSFNLDGNRSIELANKDYPRSFIPKPGFVAGPCLEKDAYILSSNMHDDDLANHIEKIRETNKSIEEKAASQIKKFFKNDDIVLLSGMSFKGVPATNDLRGSSSVNILNIVKDHCEFIVHDFMNSKESLENYCKNKAVEPKEYEINNLSGLIILNNCEEYKTRKFKEYLISLLEKGVIVIDVWNVTNLKHKGSLDLGNLFINER